MSISIHESGLVLVTAHRRDSFGEPIQQICRAVQELHDRFPDVEFLWPVHPNPAIQPVVERTMMRHARVSLCAAPRLRAVRLGHEARDADPDRLRRSPGRGPGVGKPVLVLRGKASALRRSTAGSPSWSDTTPRDRLRTAKPASGPRNLPVDGAGCQPLRRRARGAANRFDRAKLPPVDPQSKGRRLTQTGRVRPRAGRDGEAARQATTRSRGSSQHFKSRRRSLPTATISAANSV